MNTLNANTDAPEAPVMDPEVKPSESDPDFKKFLDGIKAPANAEEQTPEQPPLYTVFLANNEVTPFQTVVACLQGAFNLSYTDAEALMFLVHQAGPGGKAPIGTWTKEIAEEKVRAAKAIEEQDTIRHQLLKPLALEFPLEKTEG